MRTLIMPCRDDLLAAAAIGAAVNFPWEMAHSLLFREASQFTWWQHLLCCGGAALLDGAGIAAILGIGALVFRDPHWVRRASVPHLGLAVLLGVAGAAITEWIGLRYGWWSYKPAMPRLAGTELGLTPLVQCAVLPMGVLFWALPHWWFRQEQRRRDAGL